MSAMALRKIICQGFCRYYKPGKREEPGCGGLVWLQRQPGLAERPEYFNFSGPEPLFGIAPDHPRLLAVCRECEYRVGGCDFRDPQVAEADCSPCGGLRAVAGLLASGRLQP